MKGEWTGRMSVVIEHIAWQVENPEAMVRWYGDNLGMKVVRKGDPQAAAFFLADETGTTIIEIYHNKRAPLPDYRTMDPLLFHLAFETTNIQDDIARLLGAGAIRVSGPDCLDNGDTIAMLRDPWGLPLQLVRRAKPMVP
jgi:glyoxylase I family protein